MGAPIEGNSDSGRTEREERKGSLEDRLCFWQLSKMTMNQIAIGRSKGFSRTIPFPSADRMHYRPRSIGVFVGDSIHWCALHSRNADPYEHVDAIDIVSNTYHQLQCPDYNFGETSFVTFNLDP
ncbi:hypothetical protein LINPERHAP2_LOCUS27670 [Linum perenne]